MCQPAILSLFLNETLTRTSRQRSSVPFCQSAPQKVSSHPVCCKPKASGQHSVYISYFHNGALNNKVDWSWETSSTFYKNKQNTFKIKIWYEIYLLILSKLPGFDLVCIIVGKEHNLEYILQITRPFCFILLAPLTLSSNFLYFSMLSRHSDDQSAENKYIEID